MYKILQFTQAADVKAYMYIIILVHVKNNKIKQNKRNREKKIDDNILGYMSLCCIKYSWCFIAHSVLQMIVLSTPLVFIHVS